MASSDDTYHAAYKQVRNRLRRYDPLALTERTIAYMNAGNSEEERRARQPWFGMLLIKWAFENDHFDEPGRSAPDEHQFHTLIQSVLDLAPQTRMPNDYDHHLLFLRAITHQQFLYQRPFSAVDFIRQFILFADLPPTHTLRRRFLATVGLDVAEFLQLSLALLTRFLPGKHLFVEAAWFSTLPEGFQDKVQRLLRAVALSPAQLRAKLKEEEDRRRREGTRRRADEYHEQTALLATPLLEVKERFWVFHPQVLFRGLEHFVHDRMRSPDPSGFMDSFGKIFEAYVGRVIALTCLPTTTEAQLKRRQGQGETQVDFLLQDGDTHIMVEAKGLATSHPLMASPYSRIVGGKVRDTALKAVGQALGVQDWLKRQNFTEADLKPPTEAFLIVVTYKELHFGNGRMFRDVVGQTNFDGFYAMRADVATLLPPENIYFVPVESIERLCQAVASGRIGLAEALRRAREADREPRTAKLEMHQHLSDWEVPWEFPPFLQERLQAEADELLRLLGHTHEQRRQPFPSESENR